MSSLKKLIFWPTFTLLFINFLKAAHCIVGFEFFHVFAGVINRKNYKTADFSQINIPITSTRSHSGYIPSNLRNDIAVIGIHLPVEKSLNNPKIGFITLPTAKEASNDFAGAKATASGYGVLDNERTKFINLVEFSKKLKSSFQLLNLIFCDMLMSMWCIMQNVEAFMDRVSLLPQLCVSMDLTLKARAKVRKFFKMQHF